MEQDNLTASGEDAKAIEIDPLEILDDLCRVCGKTNDQMIPIFETHESQLADKINKYLPITVIDHDVLPLRVCITCAATISQWHTLSESCVEVNERLSQMQREQYQIEQLDTNESSLGCINQTVEIKVHRRVKELRSEKVQCQISGSLPVNGENCISGSNCSIKPITSHQSQRFKNNYFAITSPIYENINEDEEDKNAANNQPIDMIANSVEQCDDVKISYDTSEPSAAKMKLLKIQKIKDLLKKAQIKIQGRTFYRCRKCMKNFSTHISYAYHVKSHIRPKIITNECNICGKQFYAKLHLIRHMSKHHLKLRKLTCEQCCKMCDPPKKNKNDEPDSITEGYLCNVCKYKQVNKIVYTPATIIASIRISQEDCPTKCDNCQYYFPTESSLKYHISERSCIRLRNE